MFKISLSSLLLLFVHTAFAQMPVLQWATPFYDNNQSNYRVYNNGRSIGADQQGNVYSTGLFEHTIDADPGPAVYNLTAEGRYDYAIYIIKQDAAGNLVWAKQVPTLVEWGNIELKVDGPGNVYLASSFREPVDMDPGPGVYMMNPTGFRDAFVLKLDTDGGFIWAKQFGGPGDTGPQANCLDVDPDQNVIVSGEFNNTADLDPGPAVLNFTSTAHMQTFIVKLNKDGDLVWAKQFGNSPIVYAGTQLADLKTNSAGEIFVTGAFKGTCDFDPGAGTFMLTSQSDNDGIVAKLNADGSLNWAKKIGSEAYQYSSHMRSLAIDIDSKGNIITAGYFLGTFDFDPGPGVQSFSSNPYDSYVLKLTGQGDFIWVKIIGGTDSDTGNDIVLDAGDNIYLAGSYGTDVDYDPGPGNHTVITPYYGSSAIIKLTPEGNFTYAALSTSISYGTSLFRRIAIDKDLNILITGFFSGIIDAEPGPDVFAFASSNDQSPFVIKLGPCVNKSTATINISTCDYYMLNNEKLDVSGTYTRIIPNAAGCDSIITLNLTINKKLTAQSVTICEGESFFAGGANQTIAGIYRDTLQTVLSCDSIITTTLTVNPKPTPDLGADKYLCTAETINASPGNFASYLWQDLSTSANITINTSGTYWVTVSNNFGCFATDTLKVPAVLPLPANFLKNADSICSYENLLIKPLRSYNAYQWSGGSTTAALTVNGPGSYWLKVVDANGCSGMDTITVFPKSCMLGFYIPTAFTPNSDGHNDIYKPLLFGNIKQYRFAIYDRWGMVVFQSTDPGKGWDGKISGSTRGNTVFVWTCTYQLEGTNIKTEKGTVTLVK